MPLPRTQSHAGPDDEPSIVLAPELFVPDDPKLRAQLRWQAVKRDWISYTAIALSTVVIVLALSEISARLAHDRQVQAATSRAAER